jgi:hypothetical protein
MGNKPDASQPRSGTVVDPRMSLALWLRAGRNDRGMSLEDVARVTKIQARILERLEGGKLDNLPAEVFVRGFIRSFAKCCGLDEGEALTRYTAASQAQQAAPPVAPSPQARAMVEVVAELAPQVAATSVVAVELPVEPIELAQGSIVHELPKPSANANANANKKKRRGAKRAKRRSIATGTPSEPTPVIETQAEAEVPSAAPLIEEAPAIVVTEDVAAAPVDILDPLVAPPPEPEPVIAAQAWVPKMPVATPAPTVPWRRPAYVPSARRSGSLSVPSLVIDDSDPESAAQVLEDREEARGVLTNAQRRSFLPPALLDREDRSGRQGGLTLAVIILLIAATLTLSYLMRRPSSSGDGVTVTTVETQTIG